MRFHTNYSMQNHLHVGMRSYLLLLTPKASFTQEIGTVVSSDLWFKSWCREAFKTTKIHACLLSISLPSFLLSKCSLYWLYIGMRPQTHNYKMLEE